MNKLVILTGAGMSAESGIKTFRDAGGLWEGHDVMQVASPEGWRSNTELVLDFYNQRRRQLHEVVPNEGHKLLVEFEQHFNTHIITQNIDDLHERAGSSNIIHLHGELLKSQSTSDPRLIYRCEGDINLGDTCELNSQLRPFIVWFGEAVPMLEQAAVEVMDCDVLIIIGSSMQVYPAASLAGFAPPHTRMYYIDPKPSINHELSMRKNLEVIAEQATVGVPIVLEKILNHGLR